MHIKHPPSTAGDPFGLTVAIPTFGREQVLVDTIGAVLALDPPPQELLVLDQTSVHEAETAELLSRWDQSGAIRWIRLERPSITKAMNQALLSASQPLVLFLDDDIVPDSRLIGAHRAAHAARDLWAVVGQILQPGQQAVHVDWHPPGDRMQSDLEFPFNSDTPSLVYSSMGGNLSVRRDRVISIGGFDENFVGAAYRFETEFARRVWRRGGQILFDPAASIRHLQAERGGTRSYGSHLRSMRPAHSVGEYYFALSQGLSAGSLAYCLKRLARSTMTRYHLKHPWWIAPKLVGEICGIACALRLAVAGPKLLTAPAANKKERQARGGDAPRQLRSQEPLP
jgi:GT2 family glycosyltransferase